MRSRLISTLTTGPHCPERLRDAAAFQPWEQVEKMWIKAVGKEGLG